MSVDGNNHNFSNDLNSINSINNNQRVIQLRRQRSLCSAKRRLSVADDNNLIFCGLIITVMIMIMTTSSSSASRTFAFAFGTGTAGMRRLYRHSSQLPVQLLKPRYTMPTMPLGQSQTNTHTRRSTARTRLFSSTNNDIPESSATTTTSQEFATDYHAPVMWKECVRALLQQEVDDDLDGTSTNNSNDKSKRRQRNSKYQQKRNNRKLQNENNSIPQQGADEVCEGDNDGEILSAQLKDATKDKNTNDTAASSRHPKIFIDGTLGGGGHSLALLQACSPGDTVFGCDVDPEALVTASRRLAKYMKKTEHDSSDFNTSEEEENDADDSESLLPRFIPVQSNFADLVGNLPKYPNSSNGESSSLEGRVDGILLDLGVSSHQIDTAERGFAFMQDGPLDMRMNSGNANSNSDTSNGGLTAADLCNTLDQEALQNILQRYGEEPRARAIAESILQHRPLTTTGDLRQAVHAVVPKFYGHASKKRMGRTATLARVFQALRMTVNRESDVLRQALEVMAPALLKRGSGRLVVLSYHSLEDGAVKRVIRDGTVDKLKRRVITERDIYGNDVRENEKPFRVLRRSAVRNNPGNRRRGGGGGGNIKEKASDTEIAVNPRARSATLRVAERR